MKGVADPELSLAENAVGNLYVDASCIDCGTCRHLAPRIYARSRASSRSYVQSQPSTREHEVRALMALVACPTASIGTRSHRDVRAAAKSFPLPIADGVDYLGFTSSDSFGASSYLVRRPEGNVIVDSPRFNRGLLERLRRLGGARLFFLTHRDDVADHERWARELGCERVMHTADVGNSTRGVERRLSGERPVALAPDLLAIPVPGHTAGSMALLFREEILFSGDHLMGTAEGRLHASRNVCWHSWPEQLRSVEKLLDHHFTDVLPGHGARYRTATREAMREALTLCLDKRTDEASSRDQAAGKNQISLR